jgi:hypothetical protein
MSSDYASSARGWRSVAVAFVACAVALTAAADSKAGDDDDDARCRFFEGPFGSMTVPVPPCTSPVGLCTHGMLRGDFPARYDFTFATLQPANDPTDPTEFVYTGHSVVTTTRGVMHTNDSGVIHIPAGGGPAPFVTTASVADGTERYADATGVFVATGDLDFATGDAVGNFIAHICHTAHNH